MSSSTLEPFMNEPMKPMMKICTKCKEAKLATLEYFVKSKNRKSGFHGWCKECKRRDTAARLAALSPEQRGIYSENNEKSKRDNPIRTAFVGKRSRAKRDGIEWGLGKKETPEEAVWHERMKNTTHCPDCACEIKWFQRGKMHEDSGSFDRIDSNVGYLEGNVRITCRECNSRKSNSPVNQWVGLLKVRIDEEIISCVDPVLLQFLSEETSKDLN